MKRFYLTLCLLVIAIPQCFAGGPAADVYIDMLNIVDGAVAAIKTDGSLMTSDGSNAADLVDLPNRVRAVFASITTDLDVGGDVDIGGDLTGVNASFTGDVSAGGVELMKNDGSNALATDTRTNISVYSKAEIDESFAALPLDTISGNIGAASTTIELTDGVKLHHGIMFIGGATYDLSNPNHVTLDNTGDNTVITFDAVGFDTSYVILRLR